MFFRFTGHSAGGAGSEVVGVKLSSCSWRSCDTLLKGMCKYDGCAWGSYHLMKSLWTRCTAARCAFRHVDSFKKWISQTEHALLTSCCSVIQQKASASTCVRLLKKNKNKSIGEVCWCLKPFSLMSALKRSFAIKKKKKILLLIFFSYRTKGNDLPGSSNFIRRSG